MLVSSFLREESGGKNGINGFNSDRELYSGACYAEHAEMNALKGLIDKPKGGSKRIIVVDLLVIRTDRHLNLKNSRPCQKCIECMLNLPKYGYRIRNVYYSNNEGQIVRTTLNELDDSDETHVTRRFR